MLQLLINSLSLKGTVVSGILLIVLVSVLALLGIRSYENAKLETELVKKESTIKEIQEANDNLAKTLSSNDAIYTSTLNNMSENLQKERSLCQERLDRESERFSFVLESSTEVANLEEVVDQATEIKFQNNINKTRNRWNEGK